MKIIFLHHSGVLIETQTHQLFIDVITDVSAYICKDKKVYFLVTHSHGDHFDKAIFNHLSKQVRYILSDDIIDYPDYNYTLVHEGNTYTFNDFKVVTYGSTDKGVSFLIYINHKVILHSGDLNWWHWENDDVSTQLSEERQFRSIADCIPSEIDIAFVPFDPRLGSAMHYTFDYYLNEKKVKQIIPIHFRDKFDVCNIFATKYPNDTRLVKVQGRNTILLAL